MAEKKEKRAIIEYAVAKPFIEGIIAGLAVGGPASFSGKFFEGLVWGSSLYFGWYLWSQNANQGKRKPRSQNSTITVNTASGTRKVRRFEFQPGYIARETWGETLRRWTVGKPQPRIAGPTAPTVTRPAELDQFVFISQSDDGQMVELLSTDFRNFLRRAWLYRERGKGFGARFWGPLNQRSWPDWYPGPFWYQAARNLIYSAQGGLGRQLVIETNNQWYMLRWPMKTTYEHVLYWYVTENRK